MLSCASNLPWLVCFFLRCSGILYHYCSDSVSFLFGRGLCICPIVLRWSSVVCVLLGLVLTMHRVLDVCDGLRRGKV